MKQVKIGVFGGGRGISMVEFCTKYSEAKLVAICDKLDEVLDNVKDFIAKANEKKEIKTEVNYYHDFDEFIKEDMDAVILANYATEHAPYAVRCLERGLHVLSDIAPVKNLAEAVKLVEAVEKSNKIYAFGENCCFFPGVMEIRKNYRAGKYGKFLYGECEYIHDCSHIWPQITYGDRNHWRNKMYATFYCTHSIGPMIHITGERPKYVTGYELLPSPRLTDLGYLKGTAGIEMITCESGAVIKSMHGDLHHYCLYYSVYGTEGCVETDRKGDTYNVLNEWKDEKLSTTNALHSDSAALKMLEMHGGADYYNMHFFVQKILGNNLDGEELIGVYEALDMFLPGLLAYRSVFEGGKPIEIPDFRKQEDRDKYRNDTFCVDDDESNPMRVPSYSKGDPDIPDEVYARVRAQYLEEEEKKRKAREAKK